MRTNRMPALFIGHGSPMNAIVCVSAHWETNGCFVTANDHPRTIHDFGGFPRALYEKQYPAPGLPELVGRIAQLVPDANVQPALNWGLDHGTWSVLCRMYPQAEIPVVQLSLDRNQDATFHYHLGKLLDGLRDEGVLILGSGNIVHNLRLVVWEDTAFDWAIEFDSQAKQWMLEDNHEPLIHYETLGRSAALSINSAEHYLPLLYILGIKQNDDALSFFNEKLWGGSLSMRCVRVG